MQTNVEIAEQGRRHTFTPECFETPDGMFHYTLRHHVEGQQSEADEIYQIGSYRRKEEGHADAISYAHKYVNEHEFGL
ncbi:hypothetical protein [Paraburkholderia aspalathi]|uniref:hypothetical protein n=1 Tax=Paraburkholderia aspalathi TaxID=1324617 RepID=UPI0038B872B0